MCGVFYFEGKTKSSFQEYSSLPPIFALFLYAFLSRTHVNFIKNHLGPAFSELGINTKIVIYDHNPDRIDYPLEVLSDASARQYVDGTPFHVYAGNISALSTVRDAHPKKKIISQSDGVQTGASFSGDLVWHTRNLIVGATRNWSWTVLDWNLPSEPNQNPHTEGGCDLAGNTNNIWKRCQ